MLIYTISTLIYEISTLINSVNTLINNIVMLLNDPSYFNTKLTLMGPARSFTGSLEWTELYETFIAARSLMLQTPGFL